MATSERRPPSSACSRMGVPGANLPAFRPGYHEAAGEAGKGSRPPAAGHRSPDPWRRLHRGHDRPRRLRVSALVRRCANGRRTGSSRRRSFFGRSRARVSRPTRLTRMAGPATVRGRMSSKRPEAPPPTLAEAARCRLLEKRQEEWSAAARPRPAAAAHRAARPGGAGIALQAFDARGAIQDAERRAAGGRRRCGSWTGRQRGRVDRRCDRRRNDGDGWRAGGRKAANGARKPRSAAVAGRRQGRRRG